MKCFDFFLHMPIFYIPALSLEDIGEIKIREIKNGSQSLCGMLGVSGSG